MEKAGRETGDPIVAGRMHRRRLELRLSQKELALRCGASQTAISHMERGKWQPTVGMLRRLARGLNTTIAYLAGETDDPLTHDERMRLTRWRA